MTSELPPSLHRLWAPENVAEPEPRVGLSLRRIVAAAIELADAGGLDGVSMSRVAQRLGYTTMSLYRHVANKNELLVHMHDAAWQVPSTLDDSSPDWRTGLQRWCTAQRAILREHPWLEGVRVTERMGTPSQLGWLDRGLRALAGTSLSERAKTQVLLMLNGYVLWGARVFADFTQTERERDDTIGRMASGYVVALRTLADPARFPALRRALDGGAFDAAEAGPYDFDADFLFGLDRVLDGIERLVEQA